ERRAIVSELAAFARGAAAPGRFCPSAFGPPAHQGKAGGAPARRDQGMEGRSRRRRTRERGNQGALRADLQGVMRVAHLDRSVSKGAQSSARGPIVRLCPRASTCAFFVNVGTALCEMLGDLPAPLPTLRAPSLRFRR